GPGRFRWVSEPVIDSRTRNPHVGTAKNSAQGARKIRMSYRHVTVPDGDRIEIRDGQLQVGDRPIIAFIEGDGTGPDIWRASVRVLDAAVERAYGGRKRIAWMEVFAGDKANEVYGEQVWLPEETLDVLREYLIGIKGPLT